MQRCSAVCAAQILFTASSVCSTESRVSEKGSCCDGNWFTYTSANSLPFSSLTVIACCTDAIQFVVVFKENQRPLTASQPAPWKLQMSSDTNSCHFAGLTDHLLIGALIKMRGGGGGGERK